MRLLAVVSKLTGVSTNIEASEITLNSPSIVKLSVSREEISQLTRVNIRTFCRTSWDAIFLSYRA